MLEILERVAFVTSFYGSVRGGIGRYEESLYPYLKKGVEAELVPISPLPLPMPLIALAKLSRVDLRAVAQNHPCWVPREYKDGVVHLSNQTQALALLCQRFEKVIVTVHDIIPYVDSKFPWMKGAARAGLWDKLLYRQGIKALSRATRLVADSEHTKGDLCRYVGIDADKIDVVPLAVDNRVFRPVEVPDEFYIANNLSRGERYLLYVGSQEPRKNLRVAYRALRKVIKHIPNAKMLVAGGARSGHLRVIEEEFRDLDDVVMFLGFASEEELNYLYNISEVFVFPSLYEGFGLPVLEAMSCGCPVIASNATSLPEAVGDAGVLVDANNSDEWAEKLMEVLENSSLKDNLIRAGLERARAFTWDNTAKNTIEVYKRIEN